MCGIGGILAPSLMSDVSGRLARMQRSMAHRGPDDQGTFVDPAGAGLAHVRLAIFDPEHGQQPITAGDRYTIVFNGAIYNYLELRRELTDRGHRIRSYCDTEVLLHAYIEWGESCVQRLNGMFAFCVWDSLERTAFIARDRLGIKPLYYYAGQDRLIFSSEIKAIAASGLYDPGVDEDSLGDYLRLQFVLGDATLFAGISKLEPGHYMQVALSSGRPIIACTRYWDVPAQVDESLTEPYCIDRLTELVEDAVRLRLRSDVAIGAHLSGGLDSSTIVCIAKSLLGSAELNTFTGYFAESPEYSEVEYAQACAAEAQASYNEILITGQGFDQFLPEIIYHMDEPAAGPGVIPQFFVSQHAAKKVKVVLGGQGGDELFVGYARYLVAYLEESLRGAIFESADSKRHVATLTSIIESLPVLQTYVPLMQKFWAKGLFEPAAQRYLRLIDRSEDIVPYLSGDTAAARLGTADRFEACLKSQALRAWSTR